MHMFGSLQHSITTQFSAVSNGSFFFLTYNLLLNQEVYDPITISISQNCLSSVKESEQPKWNNLKMKMT